MPPQEAPAQPRAPRAPRFARLAYALALVATVAFIIPVEWFPLQVGKMAAASVLLAAAAALAVWGGAMRDFWRTHGVRTLAFLSLLPLVYGVSLFVASTHKSTGFLGVGLEVDTLAFVLLSTVALMLSLALFRSTRAGGQLLAWLMGALIVVAALQVLVIAGVLPLSAFSDRTINAVGKWNDLGLLLGLLALLSLVRLQFGHPTPLHKALYGALGAAALGGLVLVNFGTAWGLLALCAAAVATVAFLGRSSELPLYRRIPAASAVVTIIAIGGIFFGAQANNWLSGIVPLTSLEVRPSFTSTIEMASAAHGDSPMRFLLGTGPNSFATTWLQYKPAEVNQSPFWNLDFNVAYSTLTTAFSNTGLLGVLAWLVPLLFLLAGLVRLALRQYVMHEAPLSPEEKVILTSLAVGAVYLYGSLVFYAPSQSVVLLLFMLCGAAAGVVWQRIGRPIDEGAMVRPGRALPALAIVLVAIGLAVVADRRALAESIVNQGVSELRQGNVEQALDKASRAGWIEETSSSLQLTFDAHVGRLQQLAAQAADAEAQQEFASVLQETIATAERWTAKNPRDYRPHLALGQLYGSLATLGVEGALDSARAALTRAAEYNPSSPEIPLLRARLEALANNPAPMQEHLDRALTLKPNYTDAMLFVVQLAAAQNDLQTAVRAAQAAVQTAPGVASIWFQLGLLYYAGGATAEAIAPLEQAVVLVPDYANAKYFLGLSYATEGRTGDAITQFEDLALSNPDNEEVKLILSNLKFGKPPFDGAEPPVTDRPAERPSAPLP